MDSERYQRVKELFVEARSLSGAEREAFVERASGGDAEIARDVLELLSSDERADGFLERSILTQAEALGERELEQLNTAPLPERIGRFRILRLLGYGGMGVVYLAEQDFPRREVALKVLRADVSLLGGQRRFELEAQVLAKLRHPAIAQVFDAGVAESELGARPWLAMEFVRGKPLLEDAKERQLDVHSRLKLFASICDAVHAAHEQGVVHRDLKPANLLIDESGRPKVLDFGVARAIGDELPSLHTQTGQLVGTLAYMSPEQASGDPKAVDPRSDVYSLGIVLYELLTGQLPYDTRGLLLHEAVRAIREDDPTALSRVAPALRGDIETIANKALEKDPTRRYATAEALADDLRRYLANQPIQARPPSAAYQLRKFARRHRRIALGAAVMFLALAVGLTVALFALERARRAERLVASERDAVLRLRDLQKLRELEERARSLWPVGPALLPELDRWLEEARELALRLPLHRKLLARLEALGRREELGDELQFGSLEREQAAWFLERQTQLVRGLELFSTRDGGRVALGDTSLPELERRYALARDWTERVDGADSDLWYRALSEIADTVRSPRYGGLVLTQQPGLLPLGPDPCSGLWEFALYDLTGPVPQREPETGELVLHDETGLVFVLLPGGEAVIGTQSTDPGGPNYDRYAETYEGPPELVSLAPFMVSKYELTQSQYQRFTGANPGRHKIGEVYGAHQITGRNPVEMLCWDDASAALAALGLALPTEAQWEYAARGGAATAWCSGSDARSLLGFANITWGSETSETDDTFAPADTFLVHSPVGTFRPNAFGLHDVHGNVWEWTGERFAVLAFQSAASGPRGARNLEDFGLRSIRGGSFAESAHVARLSKRECNTPRTRNSVTGARPTRLLPEAVCSPSEGR